MKHYYIANSGQQAGPYTLSQLQSMWKSGTINLGTTFWLEGMSGWEQISAILDKLEPLTPPPLAKAQNTVSGNVRVTLPGVPQKVQQPTPQRQPTRSGGVNAFFFVFFLLALFVVLGGMLFLGLNTFLVALVILEEFVRMELTGVTLFIFCVWAVLFGFWTLISGISLSVLWRSAKR